MENDLRTDWFWFAAKSGRDDAWLPLWMHAKDTACVMGYLVDNWLSTHIMRFLSDHGLLYMKKYAMFLGYMHDIGKLTNVFQVRISHAIPGYWNDCVEHGMMLDDQGLSTKISHAVASGWICQKLSKCTNLAEIVSGHHGDFSSDIVGCGVVTIESRKQDLYGHDKEQQKRWVGAWKQMYQWALKASGLTQADVQCENLTVEATILLTGLLVKADWIASNTYYFPLIHVGNYGFDIDYETRVEKALHRLRLPHRLESIGCFGMTDDDFQQSFGFPMNEVQRMVVETCNDLEQPGLLILEAPMGVGKTEAALATTDIFMNGPVEMGGLYFGLPTQATTNGLFPRLMEWAKQKAVFQEQSINLAHGNAWLNESFRDMKENPQDNLIVNGFCVSGRKQTLLSDFVFGTVDQVLMAGLKQKHFMLRHLGLSSKVIVIDEVHAYDTRMMTFLKAVLAWLSAYQVPVVLLSATLPSARRVELVQAYLHQKNVQNIKSDAEDWMHSEAYPLITYTDGNRVCQKTCSVQSIRPLDVKMKQIDEHGLPDLLHELLAYGGCAAVIVNTVADAQKLAQKLSNVYEDTTVILIHSSFTMEHRARLEKAVLSHLDKKSTVKTRHRVILIGTQVLEQSLDYDVDYMISQGCPMDLLLQRMGRMWRHSKRDAERPCKEPVFYVLEMENDKSGYIYDRYLLRKTKECIPDVIHLPLDISHLVQMVYQEQQGVQPQDYIEWQKAQAKAEVDAKVSCLVHELEMLDCSGLLQSVSVDGEKALMSIRDGGFSVVPICVKKLDEDTICLLNDETKRWSLRDPLSEADIRCLLMHTMNLPYRCVCDAKRVEIILEELTTMTKPMASWINMYAGLNNELFLVFDEHNQVTLDGHLWEYDSHLGFVDRTKQERSEKDV